MTQVLIDRAIVQDAIESLGAFCADLGWTQRDMDNMDSLIAALANAEPTRNVTKQEDAQ